MTLDIHHNRRLLMAALPLLLTAFGGCKQENKADQQGEAVATTNSYLECVAGDLMPEMPIVRLAEPGMCPGHFDLKPSQINSLRRARVLLRFNFQKSLDRKLTELTTDGLNVVEVTVESGLATPEGYLSACEQVAETTVKAGLLTESAAADHLADVNERLQNTQTWVKSHLEQVGIENVPVVASEHQAGFCRWLGFDVVATFSSPDRALPAEITEAVQAGQRRNVKLIIANRPEGTKQADALAERLDAHVVVFHNFPDMTEDEPTFDAMLRNNVVRLLRSMHH